MLKSTTMVLSQSYLINGVPQWLYVNKCQQPKGTLLFIHGGPGWADSPWAGSVCQRLWGQVNTVHWDQRGCNRSWIDGAAGVPLTIQLLLDDALEVCRVLREEVGLLQRPVLIGHSWGAFLAVLMAAKAPELFHSYFGIGQLVSNRESEPLSLAFCKHRAQELGRGDLLSELNRMPETFYREVTTLFRQREIVSELGGEFLLPVGEEELSLWMQNSPIEYQSEWARLYSGCERTCRDLWPELIERDLMSEVRRLDLPVTLLQGRQDYCTPAEPVARWLKTLSCSSSKELIQFHDSAHWPQIEENEKFSRLILSRL